MKLDPADAPGIVGELRTLCERHGYTKVFAKVPASTRAPFDEAGYREEALIPGFYRGSDDAVFLGFYPDPDRSRDDRAARVKEVIEIAHSKAGEEPGPSHQGGPEISEASPADTEAMSQVYREVFETYPFPIHDPAYLLSTMRADVRYFCARQAGRIVALSSAEMDTASRNVEMTDFATLPEARGQGLARHLLRMMEDEMTRAGILTAYTIARSLSPSMNVTFARLGYRYCGTLVNNTNISGSIESMNVWHRPLRAGAVRA
jgi:putative beta-lysine N-acetyltransferase